MGISSQTGRRYYKMCYKKKMEGNWKIIRFTKQPVTAKVVLIICTIV
jgi:hypothetical protein